MSNERISDLPAATTVNSSDQMVIIQGGTTKRAEVNLVFGSGTLESVLFSQLPDPTSVAVGTSYMVTDSSITTFYSTANGGIGGVVVPVYSDGTTWRVG